MPYKGSAESWPNNVHYLVPGNDGAFCDAAALFVPEFHFSLAVARAFLAEFMLGFGHGVCSL